MRPFTLLLLGALLVMQPANAHHSFAMFDMKKTITLEGAIKAVHWANPHVWIDVEVKKADRTTDVWGIETGATNTLIRHGWKRDSLKPGDKVSVDVHPMRNGTTAGSLVEFRLEDGRVLHNQAQGAPQPDKEKS
jgi:hypothetical protein